jgi:hypothetical protein
MNTKRLVSLLQIAFSLALAKEFGPAINPGFWYDCGIAGAAIGLHCFLWDR